MGGVLGTKQLLAMQPLQGRLTQEAVAEGPMMLADQVQQGALLPQQGPMLRALQER